MFMCRSRSRSQSRSRSRSWNRSRSPVRGFRQESDIYVRNRERSGVSAQLCKDFAAGRCRRGNNCPFSHHSSESYEESRESRHRKAGAPKYSIPHESREYPMRSGRNRDASLERGGDHDSRKNGDIPCKFFAAGNCRNGKYCRFSHSVQASPNRRSRDNNLVRRSHNLDDTDKLWNGPTWSDTNTFTDTVKLSDEKLERMGDRRARDDRWSRSHNSDDMEKVWEGPKWGGKDKPTDTAKLIEDRNERMGSLEPRFSAWSAEGRWPHSLDENAARADQTAVSHGAVESNNMEALQCKMKNSSVGVVVSESGGTENWLGDMEMSPEWNYRVQPSNRALKEEHGHITQSSQALALGDTSALSREQEINREASVQLHDASSSMQPMIIEKPYFKHDYKQREGGGVALPGSDKNAFGRTATSHIDLNFSAKLLPTQSFDQNGQIPSTLPLSLNSFGQSQGAITSEPSGGHMKIPQTHTLFPEEKSINKSDTVDTSASQFSSGIKPTQDVVGSEQLTQLSASLVQFLGNQQQLPQIYAALNTANLVQMSPSANAEGSIEPDSAVICQPNEAIKSHMQYDPLCDSIDSKKHNAVNLPPFSVKPVGQQITMDVKPEIPNGGSEEPSKKSQISEKLELDADCKVSNNSGGVEAEETKKAQVENQILENDGVEKTDGDDKDDDEGKKRKDAKESKEAKGIRTFKFALVEFVKEILKPTWKEGQVTKDAYKNIVKKVVDKVTGTMQEAANIPQTQEKINQYLAFSKPKLSKLVQAYVEKFQKG
ncbi:hypothetical protein Pint_27215 [Pistacia integerrima]|uniref:Uncharacterized protein n=1 Tax=Pistacia integerrima TaxID=434235 RepID=A0ACC0YR65_9ROSI|nr:hypothetical protein Pint_27215 [Pistacia integerrima]